LDGPDAATTGGYNVPLGLPYSMVTGANVFGSRGTRRGAKGCRQARR